MEGVVDVGLENGTGYSQKPSSHTEKPILRIPKYLPMDEQNFFSHSRILQHDEKYSLEEFYGTCEELEEIYTNAGANNAHFPLGRDNKRELEKLIKANFTKNEDGFFDPKQSQDKQLEIKLLRFSRIFTFEEEKLQALLAVSLWGKEKYKRATKIFGEAAARQLYHAQFEIFNPEPYEYYMSAYLTLLEKRREHRKIENIDLFFSCLEKRNNDEYFFGEYITKNNIRIKINTQGKITPQGVSAIYSQFTSDCTTVLSSLTKDFNHESSGAFSLYIEHKLLEHHQMDLLQKLSVEAWKEFTKENVSIVPLHLQLMYAQYYLWPKKRYEEAIQLYENILDNDGDPSGNYYRLHRYYNGYGMCLFENKQYESSLKAFEQALSWEDDPVGDWNFAVANIMCEKYDEEDLKKIEKVVKFSENEKERYPMKRSIVKNTYMYSLIKSGKEAALTDYLLSDLQKSLAVSLEKRTQHAQKIRAATEVGRQSSQRTTTRTTPTVTRQPIRSSQQNTTTYEDPFYHDPKVTETVVVSQPKEKIKKRGTPDPKRAESQSTTENRQINSRPILCIESLTDNKNAREIFGRLFSFHPKKKSCFNNKVKISLHEINTLFKALKQDYNPSKGHGSHKKLTLNFRDYRSAMEEQMVTLTKSSILKEYQIIALREAFIKARVLPSDEKVVSKAKEIYPELLD